MDKIIGMGNALVDVLAKLDNDATLQKMGFPKGSMQLIDENKLAEINDLFSTIPTELETGGSAGNTIKALANMGTKTGFIGKIGNDKYGEFFKNAYAKNNIETKLLNSNLLPSGVASAFISPDGERTFGTYLGAASTLKAEELSAEMFKGYTYFYIEGYLVQDHAMILRAVELAKEAGLQICIDLASYNIVDSDKDFFLLLINKYADIVFANEEEAKALTGKDADNALNEIAKMCSIAIVKKGAEGAIIQKGSEIKSVEALKVDKVIDATGAGDLFAAGFLYGLIHGYSLEICGKIGTIVAGNAIQVVGASLGKEKWDEIKLNIQALLPE